MKFGSIYRQNWEWDSTEKVRQVSKPDTMTDVTSKM